MKLYHGTNAENALMIIADGFIRGPVFLSSSVEVAEQYGGERAVVFSVDVADEDLLVDFDLPVATLLSVIEAASYLNDDSLDIVDIVELGHSVGTIGSVYSFSENSGRQVEL